MPQKHELINQTSMCTDTDGRPVIATYFRQGEETVPHSYVVWYEGLAWQTNGAKGRTTPFTLNGGGEQGDPRAAAAGAGAQRERQDRRLDRLP